LWYAEQPSITTYLHWYSVGNHGLPVSTSPPSHATCRDCFFWVFFVFQLLHSLALEKTCCFLCCGCITRWEKIYALPRENFF
jgi:hypothetical protein